MIKDKFKRYLDQYSDYFKKYGIYILVILFVFVVSLNQLLNKPAADEYDKLAGSSQQVNTENGDKPQPQEDASADNLTEAPDTDHRSLNTDEVQSPVTNDAPDTDEVKAPKTDSQEALATSHQPLVTDPKNNKEAIEAQEPSPKVSETNQELVTSHQSLVTNLTWPANGVIINGYGLRYSKTYDDYRLHPGIDIKAVVDEEVKAALAGKVTLVEKSEAQNYTIEIDHGDGWLTRYCHLGKALVEEGQSVKTGEKIAQVGNPGFDESEEGPHLHLELKQDQQWVDPMDYLE